MQRRALLAALSAGTTVLAGCRGTLSGPVETRETVTPVDPPSDSSTQTPGENGNRDPAAASVVDMPTNGRTYALSPLRYRSDDGGEVELWFTSAETPDGPATVEARLTNKNQFQNTFRLDRTPPFGRVISQLPRRPGARVPKRDHTYRVALVFAPTADHDLVKDPPELERASDGHWRLAESVDQWLPEHLHLDAGETVRGEYALVGRPEGVGRGRPPGVYEFSRADERPVNVAVWETLSPGPDQESRFTGEVLPPLPGDGETAWFHEVGDSALSFVRPSTELTDLPARIRFTFVNRSRESTSCGHWNLFKFHDEAWYRLGPFVQTADCRVVRPGEAKVWAIRAASGEMAPCEARSYPFLGGGRYAAVAGYGHDTPRSAALMELNAPPVQVVPTGDVTTERQSGTITATSDRWRTAVDDAHRSQVELVLERADQAERSFIAEQVMRRRFRGLRNTLSFVQGVERVVLRTDDRTANRTVGYGGGTRRFRFQEQPYIVSMASA